MLQSAEAAYDDECVRQGITPPVRPEWARPAKRRGGAAQAAASGKAGVEAAGKATGRGAVATAAAV